MQLGACVSHINSLAAHDAATASPCLPEWDLLISSAEQLFGRKQVGGSGASGEGAADVQQR